MRRYLIAAILLSPFYAHAQSTGSIRGNVSFEAGSVAAHDATVHLTPLGRTVRTDDDGSYQFNNVPPGKYEVVAHVHYFNDERKSSCK